jgi:hypothetical protein
MIDISLISESAAAKDGSNSHESLDRAVRLRERCMEEV